MTICALAKLKVNGKVYISAASDSEVTTGEDTRYVGVENKTKIFRVAQTVITSSGSGPSAEACLDLEDDPQVHKLDLSTSKGVRELAAIVYARIKEIADRSLSHDLKEANELLIATPNNIYKICTDLSCFSFEEYTSTGMGEDVFNGAFAALLMNLKETKKVPTHDDLDAILRKAIEITNTHKTDCGPPIHILRLDPEFKPRRGRPKSK